MMLYIQGMQTSIISWRKHLNRSGCKFYANKRNIILSQGWVVSGVGSEDTARGSLGFLRGHSRKCSEDQYSVPGIELRPAMCKMSTLCVTRFLHFPEFFFFTFCEFWEAIDSCDLKIILTQCSWITPDSAWVTWETESELLHAYQ